MNESYAKTTQVDADEKERRASLRSTFTAWLRRRFSGSPRLLWLGNVLLLVASAAWVFADGRLHALLSRDALPAVNPSNWPAAVLAVIYLLAGVNFVWMALGMVVGSREFRHLKSLIILVALICFWLGFTLNCRGIAWQGRRWRLFPHVAAMESLGQPLMKSWPTQDGEVEGLGPFMAYPIGRPTTLILLTPPRLSANGPSITAVEKAADGAIRFELNDAGGNDWVEWHPRGAPESHIGGLQERREMTRSTSLGEDWRLVRYRDPSQVASRAARF